MHRKYIHFSDLSGRLDPLYYLSDLTIFTNRQITASIGDLCISMYSGFAAGKETQVKKENGYIQIRPTNIMSDGRLSWEKNIYVPQNRNYDFIPQKAVLFNNTNSQELVGKTAILDIPNEGEYYCSNHITVIIPNQTRLLPEYLWIILNLYQRHNIFYSICTNWNNQSGININLLKSIRIPIFSKETNVSLDYQQKIVAVWLEALSVKQQKEQEAKDLLNSIDDYILSELGIERPERTENGRFFYTSFRNIMGGELAPLSVKNRGQQSKSTLYKETKLSTIATIEKGQAITSKDIISGDYPVIAGGQSSPYNHNQYNYKGNVVTVSASGAYSGYVWYHDYPIFASDCSVIYSKDEKVYLTKYIYEILHLRQQEIYLLQKGAGQPHVYASDLAQMTIPIVPFEKQREIISHCNKLRATAEKLKQERMNLVVSARKAIETMILGE